MRRSFLLTTLLLPLAALAAEEVTDVRIHESYFPVPSGFRLVQHATTGATDFAVLRSQEGIVVVYGKRGGTVDLKQVFARDSQVLATTTSAIGPFRWNLLDATARPRTSSSAPPVSIAAFSVTHRDIVYSGYARAKDKGTAENLRRAVLEDVMVPMSGRSLTNDSFGGKKYYLGWGAAAGGDPSSMHNEVKYDVLHTHDVFTTSAGGTYSGTKLIAAQAGGTAIRNEWTRLKNLMRADDMFVQYSSGHGSPSGLAVGLHWDTVRDAVLAMPSRELVVFTMACFSGSLVDSFNRRKSSWDKFLEQGRSLFVLVSSPTNQESSTGPGTDPAQQGPNGSAGSAFGYSLWKALAGEADGFSDGVRDGLLSLEEIRDYTTWRTNQVGGHKPQVTGSYDGAVVMNAVPSAAFLAARNASASLSEIELRKQIADLDREFRVQSR